MRRYFELEDPTTVHPIGLELKLAGRGRRGRASAGSSTGSSSIATVSSSSPTTRPAACRPSCFEGKSLGGVHMYAAAVRARCSAAARARAAAVPVEARGDHRDADRAVVPGSSSARRPRCGRRSSDACARDDFRPHPSRLCDFCSFKTYCPAYGGDPEQAEELRGPGTVIDTRPAPRRRLTCASAGRVVRQSRGRRAGSRRRTGRRRSTGCSTGSPAPPTTACCGTPSGPRVRSLEA